MNVKPIDHSNRRALFFRVALVILFMGAARWLPAQQLSESAETAALPDAPQSQVAPGTLDTHQVAPRKDGSHASPPAGGPRKNADTGRHPRFDFLYPLGRPPRAGPLTPKNKMQLAASDVVDPFNLITIGATAAITIGSNPDTDYGPGRKGGGKNAARRWTEVMT